MYSSWSPNYSTINNTTASTIKPLYTKMNPIYQLGGKKYETYKDNNGNYYYYNGNNFVKVDSKTASKIAENNKVTFGDFTENPASTAPYLRTATAGAATNATPNSTNVSASVPTANKINWQEKNIDEMAALLGLENYKTADILKLYNDATNKKFDELDTQLKRGQAENLRTLEGQYDTYLNSLRNDRANSVANGMTKGANAAMQLATMYANAQTMSDAQQTYYDALYDVAQQRGTALEENAVTAYKDRQAIEQYLGSLRGTYEANSVNELAARLAASSQVEAARLQANATTKAAGINAAASNYAATAQADKMMQYYIDLNGGDYAKALPQYLNATARGDLLNSANAGLSSGNLTAKDYQTILNSFLYK